MHEAVTGEFEAYAASRRASLRSAMLFCALRSHGYVSGIVYYSFWPDYSVVLLQDRLRETTSVLMVSTV